MKNNKKYSDYNWRIVTGTFSTIVSILIVISILFSMGNNIVIKENSIKITGISGVTLRKNEIINVELLDNMPQVITKIKKESDGLSSKYKLDNGEEAYVYKNNGKDVYIKIICKNDIVYIAFSKEKAKETYNKMIKFINKR